MAKYFIGLMSGTSIDALDAVLIKICDNESLKVINTASLDWSLNIKHKLHELCLTGPAEIETCGIIKQKIALQSAQVIEKLLAKQNIPRDQILAIGSHGQTIRHRPNFGFSLQLDDPALLAAKTQIDVIANFRASDLAQEGEGAPLTPLFHQKVLSSPTEYRYILNIGGICNLTLLNKEKEILKGYDTGPGNTLIDACCRTLFNVSFDKDAAFAKQGTVNEEVLNSLLEHPYLKLEAPKSTGRETFNLKMLEPYFAQVATCKISKYDLIKTLTYFTYKATFNEIIKLQNTYVKEPSRLILCGGGAFNPLLKELFAEGLKPFNIKVSLSSEFGVDEQFLEPQTFAYFAYLFTKRQCSDLTKITGSKKPSILGALYPASNGAYVKGLY